MTTPSQVPGTGSVTWDLQASHTSNTLTKTESGGNPNSVIAAINAMDTGRHPAILVGIDLLQDTMTALASDITVTIGGNACTAIAAALCNINPSTGLSNQVIVAMLPFDNTTVFPDATVVVTLATGDVFSVNSVFQPILLYDVDPVANAGFAAGAASASSYSSPVLSVGPVSAIAGQLALAMWVNGNFNGSQHAVVITRPTGTVISGQDTANQAYYTLGFGAVASTNPYSSTSTNSSPIFEYNEGAVLVLLDGIAVAVPDILGDTPSAANSAITGAAFVVGTVGSVPSSLYAAGTVATQSPVAGATPPAGSPVSYQISLGSGGGNAYGKFVPAPAVSKASAIANIGDIEPKTWLPRGIQTFRSGS